MGQRARHVVSASASVLMDEVATPCGWILLGPEEQRGSTAALAHATEENHR